MKNLIESNCCVVRCMRRKFNIVIINWEWNELKFECCAIIALCRRWFCKCRQRSRVVSVRAGLSYLKFTWIYSSRRRRVAESHLSSPSATRCVIRRASNPILLKCTDDKRWQSWFMFFFFVLFYWIIWYLKGLYVIKTLNLLQNDKFYYFLVLEMKFLA